METPEEVAAREAQEQAAAEAARVQQINDQISALNTKVSSCNTTLEILQTSRTNLKKTVSDWNRVYNSCKTSTITQKVVVNNKFEGVCAKAISKSLPDAVSAMNDNKKAINDVVGKLDTQITKLKNHISTLNGKITNLRNSI